MSPNPVGEPRRSSVCKAPARPSTTSMKPTDSGVVSRDLASLLHPNDQRWVFPSREQIADAKLDDFKSIVSPALTSGPIEVVIVGDIGGKGDPGGGHLRRSPPRPAQAATTGQRDIGFPAGVDKPVVLTHKGRADQSDRLSRLANHGLLRQPPTRPRHRRDGRGPGTAPHRGTARGQTFEPIRRTSPIATASSVANWAMSASVEIPPEKLPAFFDDVEIAADLRTKEISADELARAKKPHVDQIEKAR